MDERTKLLRNTRQRQLVLELVKSDCSHPTADEVYSRAREKDPNISKGTVYRNLNLLYSLREIKKLPMPFGPDHYDFNLSDHYHFICRSCLKVTDADFPYNREINSSAAEDSGYVIEGHQVLLVGLCPDCAEKHGVHGSGGVI